MKSPIAPNLLEAAKDFRAASLRATKPRIRRAARRYMRIFALAWKQERAGA